MKFLTLALLLLSAQAHATKVIVDETMSVVLNAAEDVAFVCHPGIAPNGHNFPTLSGYSISIYELFPNANRYTIYGTDFSGKAGDQCALLNFQFNYSLPAPLQVRHVIAAHCVVVAGLKTRTVSEEFSAKLGEFEFSGSSAFSEGPCQGDEGE
jgi:hypothetical protein